MYGMPFHHIFNYLNYKKRPLLRCIQRFKSDLFNNMYNMHVSGNRLLSVILAKQSSLEVEKGCPEGAKTS